MYNMLFSLLPILAKYVAKVLKNILKPKKIHKKVK